MKVGLGVCEGKDFANTLGPWIATRDDTLANMAWSFEELVVYDPRGTWIQTRLRARAPA